MRELFSEVLALQLEFSSENTPSMARRGDLIRNTIPNELRSWTSTQTGAALPFKGRLNVQGKDGTGRKTFVPWVRVHSPELSPSAQKGWYVVYLFHAFGEGVSLCISHGSTSFNGREFVPRSEEEVRSLMSWGRGLIGKEALRLGYSAGVDLGSSERLSQAYERTTAFSKFYAAQELPSDAELERDLELAVEQLGQLYRAIELGRAPETDPPEIVEAEEAIEIIARPNQAIFAEGGQGFGLSAAERRTVELQAMALARSWLSTHGYQNIQDVSAQRPCDFTAVKEGIEHVIEVKGTTAGYGYVLMTANEVELHRLSYPNNVLIVVHDINLVEMRTQAYGGELVAIEAWDINAAELRPLSYSCRP